MKIDVCTELDGLAYCPIGEGTHIRRTVRFYENCKDELDCRAGKGWPKGTISRTYSNITKTYDVLFGSRTGDLKESLHLLLGPESNIAYDKSLEIDDSYPQPLGIYKTSEGFSISIHEGNWVGGLPLIPNDWFTTDSLEDAIYQLLRGAMSNGFIKVPQMDSFKNFLSKKIK